jgi:hypothetical protein
MMTLTVSSYPCNGGRNQMAPSSSVSTRTPGVDTDSNTNRRIGGSKAMIPEQDETISAGETGEAADGFSAGGEIIIGEIPAAEDPTTLRWTARCTDPTHDLLGHFDTRSQAEGAGERHLKSQHRTP